MSEIWELIDKIKQRDKQELDHAIECGRRDHDAVEARTCPWCVYTWSTTKGINARAPVWIEEAQHWGHLRCWQAHKEGKR